MSFPTIPTVCLKLEREMYLIIIPRRESTWGASIYDVHTEGGIKKFSKFADKQWRFCRQRGGRGSKSKNYVDVIYGFSTRSNPGVSWHYVITRWGESETDQPFEQEKEARKEEEEISHVRKREITHLKTGSVHNGLVTLPIHHKVLTWVGFLPKTFKLYLSTELKAYFGT